MFNQAVSLKYEKRFFIYEAFYGENSHRRITLLKNYHGKNFQNRFCRKAGSSFPQVFSNLFIYLKLI